MNTKSELRRRFLNQRQSIPTDLHQQMSRQICQNLADTDLFRASTVICAYASFRQEPDLAPLLYAEASHQKRWLFPRCVLPQNALVANQASNGHIKDFSLTWHEINPHQWQELMVKGKYGIWEPHPDLPAVDLDCENENGVIVDLILVPAVACDRRGYRLGYGAGFYDRWLPSQSAPTVGILFSNFICEALPQDAWDIALDYLLTEQGLWPSLRGN
ncbi:MAG: 5-formyltetrahydrofolate cyclo-ligase [Pseudanabaena sp. ELA607]